MKNMMKKIKAVIFDFDGVIGKGLFYQSTVGKEHPEIYEWIQENIFTDRNLVDDWMRGRNSSEDINMRIALDCGIKYELLHKLFEKSVRKMELDDEVLKIASNVKNAGRKVAIVSNNMDVFSKITAKRFEIRDIFDIIINSADHGLLKKDKDGELFSVALGRLKVNPTETLLIDDSINAVKIFEKLGGMTCHYNKDHYKLLEVL